MRLGTSQTFVQLGFFNFFPMKYRMSSEKKSREMELIMGRENHKAPKATDIAIVGMAVWYPGAKNLVELWENVLTKRQQFRRMLDSRLPLADYYDADKSKPDKMYGTRASYMDGFEFDWVTNRFPKSTFESTDLVHWLALDVATKAIMDAGLDRKSIPLDKTGVIVGNSLTGEVSRSNGLRMRWPFIEKVLRHAAKEKSMDDAQVEEFLTASESFFKSVLAPVTEDTLAGSLANTIAGRICNYFNLNGGGYTVDGACASSLLAVANSASALATGDLNLAVVGGVDISLDTFELIGFSKVGALTDSEMRVYDRDGKGFIPGEGCGFVLMKRLEDAQKDGNKIYAVLKGWGISSDGNGGITAPKASGQALALQRAYERAGYSVNDCHFIEGHGTGTAVGDKRELEGISIAMNNMGQPKPRSVGMTSLKSIVGHTKAAAGIGAFIKAVMAVNRRVLPPTAGCDNINPIFNKEALPLYPLVDGGIRTELETMRAGISAMGFGGINCHVTVESYGRPMTQLDSHLTDKQLLASFSDTEIFAFSSQSVAHLRQQVEELKKEVLHISVSEITDLAAEYCLKSNSAMPFRATLVAQSPSDLMAQLDRVLDMMKEFPLEGAWKSNEQKTIWISNKVAQPRIGFVFPGQGSQRINMGKRLADQFDWARKAIGLSDRWLQKYVPEKLSSHVFKDIHRSFQKEDADNWKLKLSQTEITQPSICLASLLYAQWLRKLGVECSTVAGHSLGELTALHWAGYFDEKTLMELAAQRGQLMKAQGDSKASMVSLACDVTTAQALIQEVGDQVWVANINSFKQTVVAGEVGQLEKLIRVASAQGVAGIKLNVSNAFHSPYVKEASEKFKGVLQKYRFEKFAQRKFISGLDGKLFEGTPDLVSYLSNQIVNKVDFVSLAQEMSQHCDLIIEVGPANILTGLIQASTEKQIAITMPVESRPEKNLDAYKVLAALIGMGANISFEKLFSNRLIRRYVPFQQKQFIVNPCERPLPELTVREQEMKAVANGPAAIPVPPMAAKPASAPKLSVVAPVKRSQVSSQELVREIMLDSLSAVTGFDKTIFSMQMRLLDDLNLDSIKAGEVIGEVARKCSLSEPIDPIRLANATLGEIIQIICEMNPQIGEQEQFLGATPSESSEMVVPSKPAAPTPASRPVSLAAPVAMSGSPLEVIYKVLADATGFEKSIFSPQMRLLDDLNLDSIKAGEIISVLKTKFEAAGEIDPIKFANATLEEIASLLGSSPVSTAPVAKVRASESAMEKTIKQTIAQVTGFPIDQIGVEMNITTDLGMSDATLLQVVEAVSKQTQIEEQFDVHVLAQSSVENLVRVMEKLNTKKLEKQQVTEPDSKTANPLEEVWVRNFLLTPTQVSRSDKYNQTSSRFVDQWDNSKVLLIHEQSHPEFRTALRDKLIELGAQFRDCDFPAAKAISSEELSSFSHLIYLYDGDAGPSSQMSQQVKKQIERLHFLSHIPKPKNSPRRSTTIAAVQFIDGLMNTASNQNHFSQRFSRSFFDTMHIDDNNLRTRCVDVAIGVQPSAAAHEVIEELNLNIASLCSGFDSDLNRFELTPVLSDTKTYKPRQIAWQPSDVILMTGGAKGITAECALEIGKKWKVKLALVGSSPWSSTDGELGRNLKRFEEAGITFKYYSCDVTNAKALETVIGRIRTDLGKITGVVHGAGRNTPKRTSQVVEADVLPEIGPKVLGAINLFQLLDPLELKIFFAFTSIIGQIGVPGNAWYGFSNEVVSNLLKHAHALNPHLQVQCFAYGMWDEVGMAAKLGSGKKFSSGGLNLIPLRQGVERFMQLFDYKASQPEVIITARLWNGSPLVNKSSPNKSHRFMEKIVTATKSVETVTRSTLNLKMDQYLRDHCYNGSYIFPTVMGLEAMVQVAAYTAGVENFEKVTFENLQLNTAIVIPVDRNVQIEVAVVQTEGNAASGEYKFKAYVRSETSKFERNCFSAILCLSTKAKVAQIERPKSDEALNLKVASEVYGPLLFHGKDYQRISHVTELSEQSVQFCCSTAEVATFRKAAFADPSLTMILGDPFLRDSALQGGQILFPQTPQLPVSCDKWEIYLGPERGKEMYCGIRLENKTDKMSVTSGHLFSEDGIVFETLTHVKSAVVKKMPSNPSLTDLVKKANKVEVDDVSQKFRQQLPLTFHEHIPNFASMSKNERHVAEKSALQKHFAKMMGQAGTKTAWDLNWHSSGQPYLTGSLKGIHVSVAHHKDHCVIVVDQKPVGCDFEAVTQRSQAEWSSLLGGGYAKQFETCQNDFEMNILGTVLWASKEAVYKLTQSYEIDGIQVKKDQNSFSVVCHLGQKVIDVLAQYSETGSEKSVMATAYLAKVLPKQQQPPIAPQTVPSGEENQQLALSIDLTQEKPVVIRWPVTFKDAGNIKRGVYFSKFFEWQGRARELAISPLLKSSSEIFKNGEFGWVTNQSETSLFQNIEVGDLLEVHLGSGKPYGQNESTVDLHYDWFKIDSANRKSLVATSKMVTTWVKIVSHGVVAVAPFPNEFGQFFNGATSLNDTSVSHGNIEYLSEPVYQAPSGVATGPLLAQHIFDTTLEDSNLVGNVYFSNYSVWQGRTRDHFMYRIFPDMFRHSEHGEPFCYRSFTKHLREAMPFDQIMVEMRLLSFSDQSIKLYFEYFQYIDGVKSSKIAFGEHHLVWTENSSGGPVPGKIPDKIIYQLLKSVRDLPLVNTKKKAA
jgi:enediyne polyketide synthase